MGTQPRDDLTANRDLSYDVWNRPKDEICDPEVEDGDWWEHVDLSPGDNSIWQSIESSLASVNGVAMGMLCAPIWMRSDYGAGSHRFGTNEISVWAHFLGEVRDEYDKSMGTATFWDNWECFYQDKDYAVCEDRGEKGE